MFTKDGSHEVWTLFPKFFTANILFWEHLWVICLRPKNQLFVGEWSILLILTSFLRISALIKVIHAPKDPKEWIRFEWNGPRNHKQLDFAIMLGLALNQFKKELLLKEKFLQLSHFFPNFCIHRSEFSKNVC